MNNFIREELKKIQEASLRRELAAFENADAREVFLGGREYLNFSSNDYLGYSRHPRVISAAQSAIERYGAGGRSSRLVSGTLDLHSELEQELAKWKGTEAALLFPTGFMANLGVVSALLGAGDAVILDRLNHASLIDAAKLSGARIFVYDHASPESLESALIRTKNYGKRLVATDSLFSMDGDFAPLPEIVDLCRKHQTWLLIDDAHASGVFGHTGSGMAEHFGLLGKIELIVGTCSKSFGSQGGFVCGSKDLIDFLINRARSFIYTTALSPASCGASLEALKLIHAEPEKRQSLLERSQNFRTFIAERFGAAALCGSSSQIVPLLIGSNEEALKVARMLKDAGIYAPAIRPPTVPKNASRLRFSLTASHTKYDTEHLMQTLAALPVSREPARDEPILSA